MTSLVSAELLIVLLSFTALTAGKGEPIYKAVGDEVVLTPDSVDGPITIIMWKHNHDIAMEWLGDEIEPYRHFKDRGMLNKLTGALTITELIQSDSGSYTAEINYKVTGTKELRVIARVSKPSVSTQCDAENKYCVFTCEGSTTDAEPITFSWRAGDNEVGSTNVLSISKGSDRTTGSGPTSTGDQQNSDHWKEPEFSCIMENPVSDSRSDSVSNPVAPRGSTIIHVIIIAVVVAVVLVIVAAVVLVIWKCRKGKRTKGTAQEEVRLENFHGLTPAASGDTNSVNVISEVQETPTQDSTPPVAPETSDETGVNFTETSALLPNGVGAPPQNLTTVASVHTNHVTVTEAEETSTQDSTRPVGLDTGDKTKRLSVISETSSEETENSAVKSNGQEEPPEDEQDKDQTDVPLAPRRQSYGYYQITDLI